MTVAAIPSIHDVTPDTLERVQRLVDLLSGTPLASPDLLVVPDSGWSAPFLDRLRELSATGCRLVCHGWDHSCGPSRTLYHRVHGWLLSRDQAEHLSRDPTEIVRRVEAGYDWFREVHLPAPELYVPPAWAMGRLRRRHLRSLPFRWYERLDGFVAASGRVVRTPLIGFEADTRFRATALAIINRSSVFIGGVLRRPVRISLHPDDLDLKLADSVRALPEGEWERSSVEALFGAHPRPLRGPGTPSRPDDAPDQHPHASATEIERSG